MSQSIRTGYIPLGNPQGLAKKSCPGGWDLTFESCPVAENLTRTGILWKMKVKLQKNSEDQIFTGENKKQAKFLPFLVYVFSRWNLSWSMGQFFGSAITHALKKSDELPLACLYWKFSLGYGYPSYFCTKGYDYVKPFVFVLILLVINTEFPKRLLKMGKLHC